MLPLLMTPLAALSSPLASCTFSPLPNTAVKDGNEASSDPDAGDAGILVSRKLGEVALIHGNDRSEAPTTGD